MKKFRRNQAAIISVGAVSLGLVILGCVPKEESLESDPNIGDLRLTEIMYHPNDYDGIDDDSLEFIEIKNIGAETIELGALRCVSGISYDFPGDAEIASNGFFVIASNRNRFMQRYGFEPDGVFGGQLKNSGDLIEIGDIVSQEIVIAQDYSDGTSWPSEADGAGYSLVPINPNPGKDETGSSFWRGSSLIGGSPGKDDENKSLDSTLLNLRITEINYHPDYLDSLGDDSLEFVEVKNVGTKALALTGVAFTSGIEYSFPNGATLQPGVFCVLASNANWFRSRYAFAPFGDYKGQLRNSADTLTLKELKSGTTLLSIAYSDRYPWSAYPDGNGWTLVTKSPNPAAADQNSSAAWRHSLRLHGSPGRDDPEPVYVNEVLTHTDPPLTDAVELYNPSDAAIKLENWFISDDIAKPMKFRIPAGTTIPAKGYAVFDEHDFNADPSSTTAFRFSEYGESVYLFSDSIGDKGYFHGFAFGAADNAVSFGRYVTSTGAEEFVPQSTASFGAENKGPRVGPVVFTEIMYHATDTVSEYIEIKNVSANSVSLFDGSDTTRTWKIPAAGFSFPLQTGLKPGEVALIVADGVSLDSFKVKYSVPDSVKIFTMSGRLDNTVDTLVLARPYVDSASLALPELPYLTIDRIVYQNKGDWPSEADGGGKSLQRLDEKEYANDPANWKAAVPSAGK